MCFWLRFEALLQCLPLGSQKLHGERTGRYKPNGLLKDVMLEIKTFEELVFKKHRLSKKPKTNVRKQD